MGAIVPGRMADLIAVRGNPLEDAKILRSIPIVMQAGVIIKATEAD